MAVQWSYNNAKMSWAHDTITNGGIGVVDLWNLTQTRGSNIKVAVIDTGIVYQANDLNGKIDIDNSIGYDNTIEDTDIGNHGTKSAGVIAANGSNHGTVIGVAPDCEITVYKLFANENLEYYSDDNFCYMLQQARAAQVDIISMSFEMTDVPQGVAAEFEQCIAEGILLVTAVGDANQNTGLQHNYPASFPGCIAVGAYRIKNGKRVVFNEFSCKSNALICLGPGKDIRTTGNTSGPANHQYTSAAAPFVAGIFTILLSYRKSNLLPALPVDTIIKYLQHSCDRTDNAIGITPDQGYGIINPMKLFYYLKT